MGNQPDVNFFQINAARIALNKDINSIIDKKYDFIYSTGLFDYFDEKNRYSLSPELKKLLKADGV